MAEAIESAGITSFPRAMLSLKCGMIRRRSRRTPESCVNNPGSNVKPLPKRAPKDRYTTASYAKAITRAADLAEVWAHGAMTIASNERIVERWSPHQLRHAAATQAKEEHGLEADRRHAGASEFERHRAIRPFDDAGSRAHCFEDRVKSINRVRVAARRFGFRVPDEMAVVGVDDDPFITELCFPPLSSVAIPWQRIGYQAALIMERLVSKQRVSVKPLLVSPNEVHARRSSDMLAVDDPDVVAALQFIRAHADQPIRPADILRVVPVYRKKLERNFRRYVDRSITEAVRRVHVEHAKHLLAETDLPMIDVANRSGFTSQAKFSVAFRREAGQTPTAYRNEHGNREKRK